MRLLAQLQLLREAPLPLPLPLHPRLASARPHPLQHAKRQATPAAYLLGTLTLLPHAPTTPNRVIKSMRCMPHTVTATSLT